MLSYFKKGIKDCHPCRKISIETLVKEIKNNDTPTIRAIRNLDFNDINYDTDKKKLKRHLPNITPTCTVSYRNDDSIIEFSGYMYFDIDHIGNAADYKAELIEKYKDHIGMMCLSCSGRGLSFFTKVENEITKSNFASIREYICNIIFKDLQLDPKTKIKSNAWYISYDPNCYFNPGAVVDVPDEFIKDDIHKNEKGAFGNIINTPTDCLPNALFKYNLISISQVINKLKFKTAVVVENKVFDLRPVEYCEVFLPPGYRIPLGKKHKTFAQIIHNLVYLNPDVNPDYIFSYINWLNSYRTVPGTHATMHDLIRYFNMVYTGIKKTDILKAKTRIKYFHSRPNTISPVQIQILSRRMTCMYKMYQSMNKISLAKQILETENKKGAIGNIINTPTDCVPNAPSVTKVTQQAVLKMINNLADKKGVKGIGIRTVKKYWNIEPIDLDEVVQMENEKIGITYVPIDNDSRNVDNGVLDAQILNETEIAIEHKPDAELTADEQRYIDECEERLRRNEERDKEQEMIRKSYLDRSVKNRRWCY